MDGIWTPEKEAVEQRRLHDEQSDKCFRGEHVPVLCQHPLAFPRNEVMCKHCGEHGIAADIVLDVYVPCKVHPAHLEMNLSEFATPFKKDGNPSQWASLLPRKS